MAAIVAGCPKIEEKIDTVPSFSESAQPSRLASLSLLESA